MRWLSYADLCNLVTWCHIKRSIGTLFQSFPFLETTGNFWRALDTYVTSHEMCASAEIWEACWHESRPELHARSRDVSRVTDVWICAVEFNVKSPLTSHLHALTSHELTWREDSVSSGLRGPRHVPVCLDSPLRVAWFMCPVFENRSHVFRRCSLCPYVVMLGVLTMFCDVFNPAILMLWRSVGNMLAITCCRDL